MDTNSFDRIVLKQVDPAEFEECIIVQVVALVHGQVVVVYFQVDSLAHESRELRQVTQGIANLPVVVAPNALVISDQGDIYGTMSDLFARSGLATTSGNGP